MLAATPIMLRGWVSPIPAPIRPEARARGQKAGQQWRQEDPGSHQGHAAQQAEVVAKAFSDHGDEQPDGDGH